jgi:hypothetical protein
MANASTGATEPGEALLRLLRGADTPAPGAWDSIVKLALLQGVAPILHQKLGAAGTLAGVPGTLADRLAQERRVTALANLGAYAEFQRIARALGEAGIPVMQLKGLHLAELVYRDISLRPMSDLDVLVPRERVTEAIQVLRKEGFGYDEDLESAVQGMLDTKCNIGLVQAERGTWLEVHWALDEPGGAGPGPVDEIWSSARPGRLGDTQALVMAPEFLLLHVCAHLACNHAFAFSLRALCDIGEIVRAHPGLDWQKVTEQALRHRWTRGVAAALRLARDHLGVPVPPRALDSLGAEQLEAALLDQAMAHVLEATTLPEGLVTAPNLLAAAGARRLRDKAALLWGRLFVPRAELALLYGVPENSPTLPLYYAVRLRDLLRRYAAGAWKLEFGDSALSAAAARHVRLAHWIREGAARP